MATYGSEDIFVNVPLTFTGYGSEDLMALCLNVPVRFGTEIMETNAAVIPPAFGSSSIDIILDIQPPTYHSEPIDAVVGTLAATPPGLLRIDQSRGVLIGVRRGVNMNTTADQQIQVGPKKYLIRRVIVAGASVNLTTAVGGIYTGPGKTGTAVVSASQVYTALTGPTKYLDTGLHISTITDHFVSDPLYLSLTTPQGVAATADVYVYGDSVES